MVDLRENLGWVIGSIATAIAMAIGWLISSGVVVNLLFLLMGSAITYFVQTRTQKRAWKREYSVKIAEQVYGSLFRDVKRIIESLEGKYYIESLPYLSFREWKEIQENHRYFMVDEKFRKRLDDFSERFEEDKTAVIKFVDTILPKIVNEETERIFNVEPERTPSLEVKYIENNRNISAQAPDIVKCLLAHTHPRDRVLRDKSEISIVECVVTIHQRNGQVFHSCDMSKFDELWELSLRRMREDKTYNFIIEERDKLLEETKKLKKEIVKRIEEPWKT